MRRIARPTMYLGIVVVVLGLSKVHAALVAEPAYDFTGSSRLAWAIAYTFLLAVTAYGVGLPDIPRTVRSVFWSAIGAAVAGAAGMSVLQLVVGDALLPRFVVFGSALLLIPWYMLCAAISSGGRARAEDRDRVFLVGEREEADAISEELEHGAERPAVVVGVMAPEGARGTAELGRPPLVEAVQEARASVIVLNREAQVEPAIVAQVAQLHEAGVRVRTISLFYEDWLGKLPLSELERVSLMFDIGEVHRARYGRMKRVVDVVIAVPALVVLGLLLPLVIIGDLLANRGHVFFSQARVGKNGRQFKIYKFRTMVAFDADGDVGQWTERNDPRVTRFGRLLRVSHLDELPQVLNILRGDLSVVGPRPEQPHYVDALRSKLPYYDLRHLVRPGLTGWAQVKYHYGADERDAMEKLQYEFFYLRHQGLGLDLRIVGRTVRSVVGGLGR